jgi:hypothetical protein
MGTLIVITSDHASPEQDEVFNLGSRAGGHWGST